MRLLIKLAAAAGLVYLGTRIERRRALRAASDAELDEGEGDVLIVGIAEVPDDLEQLSVRGREMP